MPPTQRGRGVRGGGSSARGRGARGRGARSLASDLARNAARPVGVAGQAGQEAGPAAQAQATWPAQAAPPATVAPRPTSWLELPVGASYPEGGMAGSDHGAAARTAAEVRAAVGSLPPSPSSPSSRNAPCPAAAAPSPAVSADGGSPTALADSDDEAAIAAVAARAVADAAVAPALADLEARLACLNRSRDSIHNGTRALCACAALGAGARGVRAVVDRLEAVPPGDDARTALLYLLDSVLNACSHAGQEGYPEPLAADAVRRAAAAAVERVVLGVAAGGPGPEAKARKVVGLWQARCLLTEGALARSTAALDRVSAERASREAAAAAAEAAAAEAEAEARAKAEADRALAAADAALRAAARGGGDTAAAAMGLTLADDSDSSDRDDDDGEPRIGGMATVGGDEGGAGASVGLPSLSPALPRVEADDLEALLDDDDDNDGQDSEPPGEPSAEHDARRQRAQLLPLSTLPRPPPRQAPPMLPRPPLPLPPVLVSPHQTFAGGVPFQPWMAPEAAWLGVASPLGLAVQGLASPPARGLASPPGLPVHGLARPSGPFPALPYGRGPPIQLPQPPPPPPPPSATSRVERGHAERMGDLRLPGCWVDRPERADERRFLERADDRRYPESRADRYEHTYNRQRSERTDDRRQPDRADDRRRPERVVDRSGDRRRPERADNRADGHQRSERADHQRRRPRGSSPRAGPPPPSSRPQPLSVRKRPSPDRRRAETPPAKRQARPAAESSRVVQIVRPQGQRGPAGAAVRSDDR